MATIARRARAGLRHAFQQPIAAARSVAPAGLTDDPLGEAMAELRRRRLPLLVAGAIVVALSFGVWAAGGGARASLAAVFGVEPRRELLAGVGFAVSLTATALSWRVAFRALGARIGALDACARYAAGSLVNACCPARLGDGVRAALFARSLSGQEGRLLAAAGALGAMGLCRALAQAVVIASGAAVGAVPLWPVLAIGGVVGGGATLALVVERHSKSERLERLVEAVATLVRRPRLGLGVLGWSLLAVAGQVAAAAAVASALGIRAPFAAALAITAALDVAALFPVTPGGIGITGGAVSLALTGRGIGLSTAVAAGLVFQATTTAASFAFAGVCLPLAARPRLTARPSVRIAAATAAAATLAVVGSVLLGELG